MVRLAYIIVGASAVDRNLLRQQNNASQITIWPTIPSHRYSEGTETSAMLGPLMFNRFYLSTAIVRSN